MNDFQLYLTFVGISVRCQLQYRASFIMASSAHFAISFVEIISIWFLFERFGHLKEWTFPEVALLYGMVSASFALSEAGARGFDQFHHLVRYGDFDRALIRPRSTVLQVLGYQFQIYRVGRLSQGLLVLAWAATQLGITWTAGKLAFLVVAVVGGGFLFSGLFVLQATLSFWSVESLGIARLVTDGGVETGQFPLSIYEPWFRRFFIYVVPIACINYFPAMGLLERPDPLNSPEWLQWFSPVAGVVFFLLTLRVWHWGIRRYRSTGN